MALLDAADLIASVPPFDSLPAGTLAEVAGAARSQRFEPGVTILAQDGPASDALYVIGSGTAEILDGTRLIDEPGVGQAFGELSLLSGARPTATVRAGPDLVCLVVDGEVARRVLSTAGGVAFVQSSLRRGVLQSLEREPRSLARAIETAVDREAAIDAALKISQQACSLVDDGSDAAKVGREIGASIDALTNRLLTFSIAEMGEAPAPWAWMALGSEARLEQALSTDQDHALAFDPGPRPDEEVDPYFAALAERVTAGLEAAGIPRCTGDAMAIHPLMRRSVAAWSDAFKGWMTDLGPEGSLLTSVVFDHRTIAGPLDVGPVIDPVIAAAPDRYPNFIRHLGHRALDRKPPTGFVRALVVEGKGEHAGRLDIKHGGISIVTNLARYYAVRTRSTETGTLARLRAASAAGEIDEDTRGALEEAFRLLWQLRLQHQVRQVRAAEKPDDFIDPARLGSIERLALKEAFRIIGSQQQLVATEMGVRY